MSGKIHQNDISLEQLDVVGDSIIHCDDIKTFTQPMGTKLGRKTI